MAQQGFTPQQAVNFFQQAPETAADVNALQRQRRMAELLTQRGIEGDQGQMVGGHFVAPSALSRVAQLGSALAGGYANRQVDKQEQTLAQRLMAQRSKSSTDFLAALQGTPAVPGAQIPNAVPNDDEGNPLPIAQMPGQAAVPPDLNKAIGIALSSQNPQLAGMAPDLLKRQQNSADLQQILGQLGIGGGASAGGGQPSPAGLPPGVSPQAMALILSQNPQANKLGTMFQDASKPITVAEGGTIFNPQTNQPMFTAPKTEAGIAVQGGQAAPIPQFAEAQARREGLIAGARAGAETPYKTQTVETAQGPRLMTAQQAIQQATASQPEAQGQFRGSFQGSDKQIMDAIGSIQDPQERANAINAWANQVRGTNPAAQGAPAGGPGIPLKTEEQGAYGTARAKDFAGQASNYAKSGQQGASTLRSLDELRTLYSDPKVAQGALAENISGMKNLAASFGVDIKGLGSEQAAQAITNKMALDLRSTADGGGMPGAMSDADREFLKALTPNLTKSQEGRNKIMDAQQKVAQRNLDVARLANQYEQQNGRIDAGFDKVVQDYAAKNQLFTQPKAGGGFKIIGVK